MILTTHRPLVDLAGPLRAWAHDHGYKFRLTSPTGKPNSVSYEDLGRQAPRQRR